MLRVPIRNVYYLLCYAWNHLHQGSIVNLSRLESESPADLLAFVLCDGVERCARRGMQRGYEEHEEELRTIRGRVDALSSARRFLLAHGRAICRSDDLSVNTLPNRILKATLRNLARVVETGGLRHRLHGVHRRLQGVDDMRLLKQHFRSIQVGSNERIYRFLMHLCELAYDSCIVDSRTGHMRFREFLRDEDAMARVFEDFTYNFLRIEQQKWQIFREHIDWQASSETDPELSLLPRMRTDISLRQGSRHRIVDAKYYQQTLAHHHETEKIRNAHLYQLLSYLSNTRARWPEQQVSGMLLYPRVDRTLRERYIIQGMSVDVCTVDLQADWSAIRDELKRLFEAPPS
jgi:5-methylcytosine-specific restriction enzyme subunit McrC